MSVYACMYCMYMYVFFLIFIKKLKVPYHFLCPQYHFPSFHPSLFSITNIRLFLIQNVTFLVGEQH